MKLVFSVKGTKWKIKNLEIQYLEKIQWRAYTVECG